MFLLLCGLAASAVHIKTVSEFEQMVARDSLNGKNSLSLSDYLKPGKRYILASLDKQNSDVIVVRGSESEISYLQRAYITEAASSEDSQETQLVALEADPTQSDDMKVAEFWDILIIAIVFVGAAVFSYLFWHCDKYDQDPQNSLLFATEGTRIVSGNTRT